MTREERKKVIEVLDDMKVKIDIPKAAKTQNDRNWALDVAIQALSQEPCERFEWGIDGNVYKITKAKDGKEICQQVCKDAISREDALKVASKECQEFRGIYGRIEDGIQKLPSVNPQPCDDAISRDDRLLDLANAIESDDSGYWTNKRISSALKNISSVTQKSGKWIPVSKRLPEEAFGCLVTVYDTDLRTQDEFESILPYFVGYDGETWNNADGEPIPFEVVAWMPLPKPYEPQESEE